MGEDRREAILQHLERIAKTIVPPENVFRNQLDIPEDLNPAISILDGDEIPREGRRGRGALAESIVEMLPQVVFQLQSAAPGPKLNALKCAFVKAVTHDSLLVAACYEGEIEFSGFETGLGVGRSLEGEAVLSLTLPYVLRPAKL